MPKPPSTQADRTIERVEVGELKFPLGVYPIEPVTSRMGYKVLFEAADTDDGSGEWEEWPDRYVWDIVIGADRLRSLCNSLFLMMPGRVFPILDVLGHDAFREIDPYVAYELVPLDQFMDSTRRYEDYLYEDGLCGFGAMSEDPFFYVFVDEHKIVTVRAEPLMRERIERLLGAFDLAEVEEPAGADAVAHEHRGVLVAPDDRPDLLTADEVVEHLRDEWRLMLNVDPETNVDDQGRDLGLCPWRCLVRTSPSLDIPWSYADLIVRADCLGQAEDLALDEVLKQVSDGEDLDRETSLVFADRVTEQELDQLLAELKVDRLDPSAADTPTVYFFRWLP
ncbi:MAG: hypothetical protein KF705_13825 [Phycisphaeraceae bacterium]|nr:hypothetical protein [Phycisphaeraceae bacterium]